MPRKSGIPGSPCPEFLIAAIVLISTDGQLEPDQEVLLVTVRVFFVCFSTVFTTPGQPDQQDDFDQRWPRRQFPAQPDRHVPDVRAC